MLVWWQSILVPSMLWLLLKWWINRYVNDYYSIETFCFLWKLGPINRMMRKIYVWIVRRVWTKRWKTQTLVVDTWRVNGWILLEDWSCVDEDDVVLTPWFQRRCWYWGDGVRVHRQMSVFRRLGSLPFSSIKTLSLICLHLHLCLHLNDHLLHASQLQRKREKKNKLE